MAQPDRPKDSGVQECNVFDPLNESRPKKKDGVRAAAGPY